MDAVDRQLINSLQDGLAIVERPYAAIAEALGLSEDELLGRLQRLLDDGVLSRFGPLFHAERLGGSLVLAAMAVADDDFERVAGQVNALPQVAHNYAREHALNMWFVLATETTAEVEQSLRQIEATTGYPVYAMPKLQEFYVGLKLLA